MEKMYCLTSDQVEYYAQYELLLILSNQPISPSREISRLSYVAVFSCFQKAYRTGLQTRERMSVQSSINPFVPLRYPEFLVSFARCQSSKPRQRLLFVYSQPRIHGERTASLPNFSIRILYQTTKTYGLSKHSSHPGSSFCQYLFKTA
jgi:hypothetical protein